MTQPLKSVSHAMILCVLAVFYTLAVPSPAPADTMVTSFDSARPVWPTGRDTEKNLFVGFRAVFECPQPQGCVLRITASSLYRVYLNGRFIGHGPARGPHGFYRVDQWPLKTRDGRENTLAIEVAGYNVNSFYLLDQPSFLQAEIVANGKVLASTAGAGVHFEATILKHRLQKVQRYSFQRPFIEYYRLKEGDDRWWKQRPADEAWASCSPLSPKKLLVRRVAYPTFEKRQPLRVVSRGRLQQGVPVERHPMNLIERFMHITSDPNIAYLLLSIGTLCLMAELSAPGLSVPGVASVVCFILAFMALGSLPVNWAAVALLALAVAYQWLQDDAIADAIRKALPYYRAYFRQHPAPPFIPWQTQAFSLMARLTGRDDYAEFVYEMTDRLAARQLTPRNCRWPILHGGIASYLPGRTGVMTAVYLEGFAAALELARHRADTDRARQYEKLVRAAARFVMQLQVREGECFYMPAPAEAVGGVRTAPANHMLRIDHVQHALAALMRVCRLLRPAPTGKAGTRRTPQSGGDESRQAQPPRNGTASDAQRDSP